MYTVTNLADQVRSHIKSLLCFQATKRRSAGFRKSADEATGAALMKPLVYAPNDVITSVSKDKDIIHLITAGRVKAMVKGYTIGTIYAGEFADLSPYAMYGDACACAVDEVRTIAMRKTRREQIAAKFANEQPEDLFANC